MKVPPQSLVLCCLQVSRVTASTLRGKSIGTKTTYSLRAQALWGYRCSLAPLDMAHLAPSQVSRIGRVYLVCGRKPSKMWICSHERASGKKRAESGQCDA